MLPSAPADRHLSEHAVRARRTRALTRLADRRRAEAERAARARAMARHPAGHGGDAHARLGRLDTAPRPAHPILEVVR